MNNTKTPSQIKVLEEHTRAAFACSLPQIHDIYCYFTPLYKSYDGTARGREIETGKRGGVRIESKVVDQSYFRIPLAQLA